MMKRNSSADLQLSALRFLPSKFQQSLETKLILNADHRADGALERKLRLRLHITRLNITKLHLITTFTTLLEPSQDQVPLTERADIFTLVAKLSDNKILLVATLIKKGIILYQ